MNKTTSELRTRTAVKGGVACALLAILSGLCVTGCVRSMLRHAAIDHPTDGAQDQQQDTLAAEPLIDDKMEPQQAGEACFKTAESLAAHGHDAEAIRLLLRARKLDPKLPSVSHRLAVLYDRQRNDHEALKQYQDALRGSPRNPDLLSDFGYFHYQRGSVEEARQLFERALQQAPDHQRARINLAMSLGQQGEYDACFREFSRAVGPAAAHSNLGMLHAQAGHIDEARQHLNQALRLNPSLPQAVAALDYLDKQRSP